MHTNDLETWAWAMQTGFGQLVIALVFLTWGLLIIHLVLSLLMQIHKLCRGCDHKQKCCKKD